MSLFHEIIVVGGGASGITASIVCRDNGNDVAILEGQNRIGKKILTTGNGRCNLTNKFINMNRYHSENRNFFENTLKNFSTENTLNFFSSLGLPLAELDEGKMYPLSLQASSVLDVFRFALEDRNIPVYLDTKVKEVIKTKNGFKLITNTETTFECSKLIFATGGMSAANTGSDGSGYSVLSGLGHTIIKPVPALVQLKLSYKNLKAISGVKFDGTIGIYVNNELMREEFGEILFTDYGISGPPVLQLSRIASKALMHKHKVLLKVDLMPSYDVEDLEEFLENHWGTFSYRSVSNSLIGILNKKLIPIVLKESGINDIHKPCYELDWNEKKSLYETLKAWRFEAYDTNSFASSQVTAGGVDTREVDDATLESKVNKNLFLCGEVLDVDGDCGGFNLQWAWSSGYMAAINACK